MPTRIGNGAPRPNTSSELGSRTATPASNQPATTQPSAPIAPDAPRTAPLPRSNATDGPADSAAEGASRLSTFINEHRRPIMAVLAGVAAVPSLVGVANATEVALPNVENEAAPEVDLSAAETETFDRAKLKDYSLFKAFWNSGNSADGTAHEGLDEVTTEGVDTLYNFALNHNLDGSKSADGAKKITKAERELVKTILEDRDVGTFFELDALPKLYSKFGIPSNSVQSVAEIAAVAKASLAKALGVNASEMKLSFPDAGRNSEMNYFAMDGAMAEPMSYVDAYREALGLPKAAEAYEKAPVLGYMTGEAKGHTKYGSFSESKPFSTSGLNWGPLVFPGDAEVASLPAKKGFDFPIDALTGFNRAVGGFAKQGDTIQVVDKDGNALTAEKVIHKDSSGKAESWSAVFKDADGNEVSAKDVTGLIKDKYGNTKGDGKAESSMSMGWWGFCDRNTAGSLYKSKFKIPELNRDVKIEINGKTITIPKADAQKLIDVDMTDMAGRTRFVGSRFNDEPMTIHLTDGTQITGKVKGYEPQMGPTAKRLRGDDIIIYNSDILPLQGSIQIKSEYGSTRNIDLSRIESITKKADSKEVTIKYVGRDYSDKGELSTDISFAGAETLADGSLLLKNSKENPIIGEFVIDQGGGQIKRVKASEIKSLKGELQAELRITDYLKFIQDNDGMYASDNAKGVIVSNGMRWINKIDVTETSGSESPEWIKDGQTYAGVEGPLTREAGDKLLSINGLYKSSWGNGHNSQFRGWVQLSSTGKVINEGFTSGEPDFGWAANNPLNWNAASSFNPNMMPEMRLKIFINGFTDMTELEGMAERLNFPSNWRDLRTPEAAAPTNN